MTEEEWRACGDPKPMLEHLDACGAASVRKLRLFAAACCRRVWPLITDARCRRRVEDAERFADGLATEEDMCREGAALLEVIRAGGRAVPPTIRRGPAYAAYWSGYVGRRHGDRKSAAVVAWNVSVESAWAAADAATPGEPFNYAIAAYSGRYKAALAAEQAEQAAVLRDLVPHPRTPPAADARWLTPDVMTLAGHVYHDRAFAMLPDLSDALEEAGCSDADLLAHLRSPGTHVRGCWALDLVLGKG